MNPGKGQLRLPPFWLFWLTEYVEHEADKSVIVREWQESNVSVDHVLEVVDHRFAIKEVVCHGEEVPIERFAPRITALFCEGLAL